MKLQRILILTLALTISLATIESSSSAQTTRTYQQMTASERTTFVREQAQRIACQMSGTDYQFTDAFAMEIQDCVDAYVQRIGNNNAGFVIVANQTVTISNLEISGLSSSAIGGVFSVNTGASVNATQAVTWQIGSSAK